MKKSKRLWIFLCILTFINLVFYLTRPGGDKMLLYVSDLLPVICSGICVFCLVKTVKKFQEWDFTKTSWLMIHTGIALYFIAEITYGVLEVFEIVDMDVAFPTIADYIWAIGYIPIVVGLLMMFTGYLKSGLPMGHTKLYCCVAPLVLILLSVVFYFLLIPIFRDPESSGLVKFFYIFYPVADLFIVIPAVLLMYITHLFGRGIISKPWKYLAFGFMLFTVGDLLYAYLDWMGKYESGNLIDLGWNVGYLLIALAAVYQTELLESFNGSEK
ncbi:MAG TPA: hypothetical protein PKH02_01775 [Bacteroidales bacterium]|nr:hypothetical protein [Bacteroidales bacterium]